MGSILGSLGSLVLSLETNISQYSSALSQAEQISASVGKNIERNLNAAGDAVVGKLQNIAQAAASIATLASVAAATKEINAATAALDDMSERTGIAVEELSRMSQVAKVGGHSLDGVEAAAGRLVKGLAATDDETKGVGKALDALGIKARDSQGNIRPLGELLPEISRELNRYADSSSKTALAQDLLGKAGTRVLPFLKDYAEMGSIVARVTADQAARAEQLEKTWNKLALEQENMRREVVMALTPALLSLSTAILDAKSNSDSLTQTITRWAQDGTLERWAEQAALALATLIDRIKTAGAGIVTVGVGLRASINDLEFINKAGAFSALPTPENFGEMLKAWSARQKSAQDFVREWEALLSRDANATRNALAEQIRLQREYAGLASAFGIGMEGPKPQLGYKPDNTKALKEQQKAAEELAKTLNELYGKPLGFDSGFLKSLENLTAAFNRGDISVDRYRESVAELMAQQPFAIKLAKHQNDEAERAIKADEELRQANEKRIMHARVMVESMEFELSTMQMTNKEREVAIALRQLEAQGVQKGAEAYELFARRIRTAIEAREFLKDQISLWQEVESIGRQAWDILGDGGEDMAERVGRSIKRWIWGALYELTLKAVIINVGANITGMSPAGFAQQMGTSYLGGNGSLLGYGSTALGLGEFYAGLSAGSPIPYAAGTAGYYGGIAGANLGSFVGMQGGWGTAAGAGVSGLIGGVVGYFGAGAMGAGQRGQQVGAAAGAIGAAIGTAILPGIGTAIGAVLGALVGKFTDPDGLAQRSAYFGQIGPGTQGIAYESRSAFGRFGFSDTSWFSDDEMKEALQGFLTLQTAIDNAIYGLASPEQRQRISRELEEATRRYSFGTEHGDFSAQLATVARDRLEILIGELYPDLTEFIQSFQGSLQELYQYVGSFLDFRALIRGIEEGGGPMDAVTRAIEQAQHAWVTAMEASNKAIDDQIKAFDYSAEATAALAQSTTQYYLAQVNLLAQIEQIRIAVSEMFGNTARTIELAGLDEQGKYNFYQAEAESLFEQLMTTSDPEAIRRFAERINEDILAAFNLLSPEQQRLMSPEFLERLQRLNSDVNDRLREVETKVEDRVTEVLNRVQAALNEAAERQLEAARTQGDAVDRFGDAVDRLINDGIPVRVRDGGVEIQT